MMGHRGKLSGEEWDAFSRRSRQLLGWGNGQIKKLKKAYAKRSRKRARFSAGSEVAD